MEYYSPGGLPYHDQDSAEYLCRISTEGPIPAGQGPIPAGQPSVDDPCLSLTRTKSALQLLQEFEFYSSFLGTTASAPLLLGPLVILPEVGTPPGECPSSSVAYVDSKKKRKKNAIPQ